MIGYEHVLVECKDGVRPVRDGVELRAGLGQDIGGVEAGVADAGLPPGIVVARLDPGEGGPDPERQRSWAATP